TVSTRTRAHTNASKATPGRDSLGRAGLTPTPPESWEHTPCPHADLPAGQSPVPQPSSCPAQRWRAAARPAGHRPARPARRPAGGSGSVATMEQHDGRYLNQVAAYYTRLAAEAPPQAGQELRSIGSAYQQLASSLVNGGSHSLSQIEQQIGSLTSSGPAGKALKQLILYVTTKCA